MQQRARAVAGTLLWLSDIGTLPPAWFEAGLGWLGEAERQRCARFVREARRRQFIASRVLLRMALGELLDAAPRAIVLQDRPGNAPALAHPRCHGLGLSIAHSGHWVACALRKGAPVGLDIECPDPARALLPLAEQAFGSEPASRLAGLGEAERAETFYRMWCRHEAHIKLGCAGGHDRYYRWPGLVAVLSSTEPLEARPDFIDLAGFGAS